MDHTPNLIWMNGDLAWGSDCSTYMDHTHNLIWMNADLAWGSDCENKFMEH